MSKAKIDRYARHTAKLWVTSDNDDQMDQTPVQVEPAYLSVEHVVLLKTHDIKITFIKSLLHVQVNKEMNHKVVTTNMFTIYYYTP